MRNKKAQYKYYVMHSGPQTFASKILYKEVNKIVLKHLPYLLTVFFNGGVGVGGEGKYIK